MNVDMLLVGLYSFCTAALVVCAAYAFAILMMAAWGWIAWLSHAIRSRL
jgi:hypothetical protein